MPQCKVVVPILLYITILPSKVFAFDQTNVQCTHSPHYWLENFFHRKSWGGLSHSTVNKHFFEYLVW